MILDLQLLERLLQRVDVSLQLGVAAQPLLLLLQPVLERLEAPLILLVGRHQLLCFTNRHLGKEGQHLV